MTMVNGSEYIGERVLSAFEQLGAVLILFGRIVRALPGLFTSLRLVTAQMMDIGVRSIPLVFITAVFTGAVTAWQSEYQMQEYVPIIFLGTAVSKAVFMELGPALTALVIAGRVGSSIAAELGTMQVTEQIDALETLAIDPVRFLAMPRFAAGVIMVPVLVILADFFAMAGAVIVATQLLNVSPNTFWEGVKTFFHVSDVLFGLVKAFAFGGIVALMGCHFGFLTQGGAEGVGRSAIKAVVYSSVLILISDYLIATLVFHT
jgi:phospholipid/cholesterol/gamma-HCH transport system permease protein